MSRGVRMAVGAWLITAVYYFYFYEYTLRSAPAVMMPLWPPRVVPTLYNGGLAIVLTRLLKETGPAAGRSV